MNLRIDQIKSIKVPLNTSEKSWSCLNACPQLVSLYDVIQSYLSTKSISIYTDGTLKGNGTSSNRLGLAQQGATVGQVLTWNGTSYIPQTPPGEGSVSELNDLVDVNIVSPTAGSIFYYNGTAWANARSAKNIQTNNTGTVLVLPNTPIPSLPIDVYLNGVLKEETEDYTISGNTITFNFSLIVSDKLTTKYYY